MTSEQKTNAIIGKWKHFFGNTDDKILQLYMQRKRDYLKCLYDGMTDEQAQNETEHYQDEIDKLMPKKKEEPEPEIGTIRPHLSLVGSSMTAKGGGKLKLTINGLETYCRLFIQRDGYDIYIGNGKWAHISEELYNELL